MRQQAQPSSSSDEPLDSTKDNVITIDMLRSKGMTKIEAKHELDPWCLMVF